MWRRTRYARSGRLRIAYEVRRGRPLARRPTLVLIQGLGYDRAGWAPVLRALGRHLRLVLIDNRGSGRSDPSPLPFTVADMARDIASVIAALKLGPVHVMGVSLGGMVAQELAIDHPDLVDALVLVATTPGWPDGYPMPARSISLLAASGRLPPAEALRRHVENALSPATVRDRPALVAQLLDHSRVHPTDAGAWKAQMRAGAGYAGNRRRSKIRARTLVLHGGADAVVDPRNAQLLASGIPDARLVVLPGLGHLFFWEDPRGFAAAVLPFLLGGSDDR